MNISIELIAALLLIAALVAMAARLLKIPYTIGLVVAGIVLALLPFMPEINLTKELIFSIFLPPLIYEAAIYIKWQELRRDLPVILTLATVGVLLSAGLTAAGMHYFVQWQWQSAILFGILIAATDPVSVIATFKEAGVHGRLRLLVEAESLFNDGTAAVAFNIALAFAVGGSITAVGTVQTLVVTVAGGILCGVLVAGSVLLLAGRTDDHLIEITLTTVAAYGSFLLAEHFHVSGVLATLVAGLLTGNIGSLGSFSDKGREAVESFWEYIAFVANSLIFILIGIREARQDFTNLILPIGVAVVLVLVGRAIAVYPLSALFSRSALKVSTGHQHTLFWGGLRGALALALALGLPPELPQREAIVTVAFGVVAFSIFAQGLTMVPLLRKLKEIP
ncbi:MAG: sodium:proton antiporter [Anaerolineales bacterium]|nr:sodium:proton antiporter [Anaerolineales bacterium]